MEKENNKARRHFIIKETTNEEIKRLAELNNVNHSFIVQRALDYYLEHEGQQYPELYTVLENLISPVNEELKRLRFSGNETNKDLSMIKEFWNHHFATANEHEFVSTEKVKTDEFSLVERLVDKQVKAKRQSKLSGD